jgi:hypothetical protein
VTLSGRVTESGSSSGIPGAALKIADSANAGQATTTDASGNYAFANLQPAGFTVSVSAEGYVTKAFGVTASGNTTRNFALDRSGPRTQFGAGQWLVGPEIVAGRYFADPASGCYWERQSGLGGTLGEVLANEFIAFNAGQWIVDIAPSDRAFETDTDCGTWSQGPRRGAMTDIAPGMWLVGQQLSPGTYRAQTASGCYWERLRDFSGTIDGIVANDFVSGGGQQLVTIRSEDVGFDSDQDCGTWVRVASVRAEPTSSQREAFSRAGIERNRSLNRHQEGGHD